MIRSRHTPLDTTRIQTTSLRKRPCRLYADMLAGVPDPAAPLQDFFASLPRLGAGSRLLAAADVLAQAGLAEKNVLWLIDSALIEAGLSTLVIRMIQRGLVRGVAMTGKAAVADFELALLGRTVEEVKPGLQDGLLGLARETGEGMNSIVNEGVKRGFGLGECLGRGILDRRPPHFTRSILAASAARLVPCTVHLSIGADGFHRHPAADGSLLGKGSLKDLHILGGKVERLAEGGVVVAAGVGPALRDVFYHAYATGRNLGSAIEHFSLIRFGDAVADFDELPGLDASYHLEGPLELIMPLFAGVLFSMVE